MKAAYLRHHHGLLSNFILCEIIKPFNTFFITLPRVNTFLHKKYMKHFFTTILICASSLTLPLPATAESGGEAYYSNGYFRRGAADVAEISCAYAGHLKDKLGDRELRQARVVVIDGNINGDDIALLRKLCSRSACTDANNSPVDNYVDLDLSRTHITTGGYYYSSNRATRDEVGDNMFYGCTALRTIILPEFTSCLRKRAFYGCNKLEDVMMPRGVRFIDDEAFYSCSRLRKVDLPEGIERIGARAFYNCLELPNVRLPYTLREIGNEAFSYCPLRSISLPRQLATLGNGAFSNTQLTQILIPASTFIKGGLGYISTLTRIDVESGNSTYISEDGILYCDKGYTLHTFPMGRGGDVTVPDGVTRIGSYAFSGSKVKSVYLPESVAEIGEGAFQDCSSMASVSFAESVKAIGDKAFSGCSSITSFVWPNGVSVVGAGTFQGCKKLESIRLSDAVTDLRQDAFRSCEALQSINLPERLVSIGKECFRGCKLLDKVVVPSTVKTLSFKAFNECKNLKHITLNEGLKVIEESALDNCNLLSIDIPSTVEVIDKKMVDKNKNLQRIVVHATTPPMLKSDSEKNVPLYVPSVSVDAYAATKPWKNYKKILPIE